MPNKKIIAMPVRTRETVLNIALYTKETFYNLTCQDEEDDISERDFREDIYGWKDMYAPFSISGLISDKVDGLESLDIPGWSIANLDGFRMVVLDEEYEDWLKTEQANDSTESRSRYMYSLSDAKCDTLLKKNGMSFLCAVMMIPIMCVFEKGLPRKTTKFRLKDNAKKALETYLKENIYQGCDVSVPGYILRGEEAIEESERLESMCAHCTKTGESIRYGRFEEQRWERDNTSNPKITFLSVPVYVSSKLPAAKMDVNETLFHMFLDTSRPLPETEFIEECGALDDQDDEPVEPFDESDAQKGILDGVYGCVANVVPMICSAENLPDLIEDLIDGISEKSTKC